MSTKICKTCGLEKLPTRFPLNKGYRLNECKDCAYLRHKPALQKYNQRRRKEKAKYLREYRARKAKTLRPRNARYMRVYRWKENYRQWLSEGFLVTPSSAEQAQALQEVLTERDTN